MRRRSGWLVLAVDDSLNFLIYGTVNIRSVSLAETKPSTWRRFQELGGEDSPKARLC
jgi:hypothetical protein